jgi:hypothetical protein
LENLPLDPPTLPQFMEILRQSWVEPKVLKIEKQFTAEELARNIQRRDEALAKIREMLRAPK